MNFSLNEMEATAKRATRGAGYSWGQAEEASKATRWLCAQGLDGAGALAQLLEQGMASDPAAHRPEQIDRLLQGEGALCPLSVGPLLSDAAHLLKTGPIEMRSVTAPALMLPFACHAARTLNEALTIEIDTVQSVVGKDWLMAPDDLPEAANKVVVSRGGTPTTLREQQTRAYPDPQDWDILNRYAHRTYAPATEESRLLGAGSGLSDND